MKCLKCLPPFFLGKIKWTASSFSCFSTGSQDYSQISERSVNSSIEASVRYLKITTVIKP